MIRTVSLYVPYTFCDGTCFRSHNIYNPCWLARSLVSPASRLFSGRQHHQLRTRRHLPPPPPPPSEEEEEERGQLCLRWVKVATGWRKTFVPPARCSIRSGKKGELLLQLHSGRGEEAKVLILEKALVLSVPLKVLCRCEEGRQAEKERERSTVSEKGRRSASRR